jgi:hypothetical protein
LNTNKITFRNTRAFVFGAFLIALPASATTISFTTSASGSASDNYGTGAADFNFTGANVGTTTLSNTAPGTAFNGTVVSDSFGELTFASGTPNSNIIDVKLTPTVNGGAAAAVSFDGTISSVVVGGQTAYSVNFSGTTGGTNVTSGALSGYTELTSNGLTYAIKTVEQLNTGTGSKQTWVSGYIMGVPGSVTPEPATLATTGLALALIGFSLRRKKRVNS